MTWEQNEELLEDYIRWRGENKIIDTSPAAYLVDKAKSAAYEKIISAIEYLNTLAPNEDIREDTLEQLKNILEE